MYICAIILLPVNRSGLYKLASLEYQAQDKLQLQPTMSLLDKHEAMHITNICYVIIKVTALLEYLNLKQNFSTKIFI